MFIFGIILLVFLIGIYPFLDIPYTKRLKETGSEQDRIRYYKYVVISEWIVVSVILIFCFIAGKSFASLGFQLPTDNASEFAGMLTGFLVAITVVIILGMKIPAYRKMQEKQLENVSYLLPTGRKDKIWGIGVALTAGICEEIIYRGFLFDYLSNSPYGLEGTMLALVVAVIFGIAHIYQGFKGFLLTTLVGFAFGKIYLETGSLLFPIIIHALVDMRSLLFIPIKEKENK